MWYKLKRIMMRPNGVEKQVRPKRWQPDASRTLLYLKFNNNLTDSSGNWVTVTTNGGVAPTYWTINSENYAIVSRSRLISTLNNFDINNMTFSCWIKKTSSELVVVSYWWGDNSWIASTWKWNGLIIDSSNRVVLFPYAWDIVTSATIQLNTWTNIIIVANSWTSYIYINWELKATASKTFSSSSYIARFLANPYTNNSINNPLVWNIDELILENKVRTAQEAADYYNLTKWNYWL
jgi:hypothetical protein